LPASASWHIGGETARYAWPDPTAPDQRYRETVFRAVFLFFNPALMLKAQARTSDFRLLLPTLCRYGRDWLLARSRWAAFFGDLCVSVLQQNTVRLLRSFRENLINIRKENLTYAVLTDFVQTKNRNTLLLAGLVNNIGQLLQPYADTTDVDILDAVRSLVVERLDSSITAIDAQAKVRSVLEELIPTIKDTKLAALLIEFNAAKEAQPNLAAIGLRTILCLVIQERAKIFDPKCPLATRQDLALQPMLDEAITARIFPEGQIKLLQAYRRQGLKEHSDNVVHKPGSDMLVSKDDLSGAVDLLNKLLPTLI
jgi:hypothetical protein